MAVCSSLSVLQVNSVPRISSEHSESSVRVKLFGKKCSGRSRLSTKKLNAGGKLALIEPDLNEDPKDRWATNGIDSVRIIFILSHIWIPLYFFDFF